MLVKKIFLNLSFILAITTGQLSAMENLEPLVQILSAPVYDQTDGDYKIEAFNQEAARTGYIYYKRILNNPQHWTICELWVDSKYRNQGLGLQLLKSCLERVNEQKGAHITWFVNSFDSTFDRYETANIYSRMFAKIDKNRFNPTFEVSSKSIIISVECK